MGVADHPRARRHSPIAWISPPSANQQPGSLARHGIDRCLQPGDDFSSEGLLAFIQLRSGQSASPSSAANGRELLVETLSARGSMGGPRRSLPARAANDPNIEGLLARWKHGEIGAVTVTSGENLRNLFDMLGVAGQDYL